MNEQYLAVARLMARIARNGRIWRFFYSLPEGSPRKFAGVLLRTWQGLKAWHAIQ
ncbi:MAG TPA: hypothetical protein VFP37_17950 [Steroidobacteraceae bacterium]|nr:hypothetical protein [Steroidobacteraceae bacterium]